MKIALVYDRINKFGGAERILTALHELWPQAPLYTAVYDPKGAGWARGIDIRTSFLQQLPFAARHHEFYPWATPLAFESFSFDQYDVVLSITSAEAKNIITKPTTTHICYCLTPTRYLWSGADDYLRHPGLGWVSPLVTPIFANMRNSLRKWDQIAATRPDYIIPISDRVAGRIKTYYKRPIEPVIYPPIVLERGAFSRASQLPVGVRPGYFLTVARLVGYKRIDLVISAFNELGWPLVIIGDGKQYHELAALAGPTIHFVRNHLTDDELVDYYQNCRAFVFAGDEDFGLAAAEAQEFGKPVIAYRKSGISEIVRHQETGFLFNEQSTACLVAALRLVANQWYNSDLCQTNAERFHVNIFKKHMRDAIETLHKKGRNA